MDLARTVTMDGTLWLDFPTIDGETAAEDGWDHVEDVPKSRRPTSAAEQERDALEERDTLGALPDLVSAAAAIHGGDPLTSSWIAPDLNATDGAEGEDPAPVRTWLKDDAPSWLNAAEHIAAPPEPVVGVVPTPAPRRRQGLAESKRNERGREICR